MLDRVFTLHSFILRPIVLSLVASEFTSRSAADDRASPATPLKILFLGDRGHHQPLARFRQLQPALAPRGIDVTYTEDLGILSHTALAKYDDLLLYANKGGEIVRLPEFALG